MTWWVTDAAATRSSPSASKLIRLLQDCLLFLQRQMTATARPCFDAKGYCSCCKNERQFCCCKVDVVAARLLPISAATNVCNCKTIHATGHYFSCKNKRQLCCHKANFVAARLPPIFAATNVCNCKTVHDAWTPQVTIPAAKPRGSFVATQSILLLQDCLPFFAAMYACNCKTIQDALTPQVTVPA